MAVLVSRAHASSLPPSPPSGVKHSPSQPIPPHLRHHTESSTPRTSTGKMTRQSLTSGEVEPCRRQSGSGTPASTSPSKSRSRSKVELEDFELIRVLGRGCAGRVLLVRHSHQNTIHAMKAISKRSVLASDELTHILTELDILKRLAIHEPDNDFVTRLNCSFTDRENFYFVMDFYPGGDLATQLEMYITLGSIRTRFYAADLVLGLEDLHRQGVILRDLKPENILLNASGHCVLADFGLSKEFPYRGEPEPLQVPQYQGEMVLPHWAGQGMGSVRLGPGGQQRVVVDRAWSFVGTTEYLSPEVVKGQDYSYAIDWWSLGCILFECLIGRVPFRSAEEESAQVLYNRICHEPWDWMLDDPKWRRRREANMDPVTEGFLDALLQKDPMRRLTEPCVKNHFYFSHIDWELVRSGEYVDPHPLNLHPLAEYNTRYFPKLCLEQDPNVDMSTHNPEEMDNAAMDGRKLTALNDENTFKFEQLKYRRELEGFYWNRGDGDWMGEGVEDEGKGEVEMEVQPEREVAMEVGEMAEGVEVESDVEAGHVPTGARLGSESSGILSESGSYGTSSGVDSELADEGGEEEASIVLTEVDDEVEVEAEVIDMVSEVPAGKEAMLDVESQPEIEIDNPTPVPVDQIALIPISTTPKLTSVALSGAMSSTQLGSPVASPERLITPDTSSTDIPVRIRKSSDTTPSPSPEKAKLQSVLVPEKHIDAIPADESPSVSLVDHTFTSTSPMPELQSTPTAEEDTTAAPSVIPTSAPVPLSPEPRPAPVAEKGKASADFGHLPPATTKAPLMELTPSIGPAIQAPIATRTPLSTHKPIPIPLIRLKSVQGPLPSGPPASGLSVSDIVSIPSPGLDGVARLIRRHPQLTSIDSVPASRLSIDLNGTITQLGEDDWEALEGDGHIPSAQNGVPPSSFFLRLRRRPSNLVASGLRRTSHASTSGAARSSESSRESSPTKGSTPRPAVIVGTTKKALGRLKAFPLLRSRKNSGDTQSSRGLADQDINQRGGRDVGVREGAGNRVESHASLSTSASPPSTRKSSPDRLKPIRPEADTRRHTESGWFERKLSRSGRYFKGAGGGEKDKEQDRGERRSLTGSSEGSGTGTGTGWGSVSASASDGRLGNKAPRVELNAMGSPVDWEFKLPVIPVRARESGEGIKAKMGS